MKRLFVTCLLTLLAAASYADLENDVLCREISFSQSTERQDMASFRSHIDVDARFVGLTVRKGVDSIAEGWAVFFTAEGPSIKWRPQIIEVLENGALALSRGPYRMVSKDAEGNAVESWGTFNSIWRLNDDGQWRVVFDAGSPASREPDEETKALLDQEYNCG